MSADRSDFNHTADGVEIVSGLRCLNNNLEWGTIAGLNDDGWHDWIADNATHADRFNGERLATVNRISDKVDPHPLCRPLASGEKCKDGRDRLFCGSVANPAGFCCEHGAFVRYQPQSTNQEETTMTDPKPAASPEITRVVDPAQNGGRPFWTVEGQKFTTKKAAEAAAALAAEPAEGDHFDSQETGADAESATPPITVTIWGPNLAGDASGQMHAHSPECKDPKRRAAYKRAEAPWTIEVTSVQDIVEGIYSDHIAEAPEGTTWEHYRDEVIIFPCTGLSGADAPATKPAPKATTKKPAKPEGPAKPAIVVKALEVRKANKGKLPADLKAATVQLTDDQLLEAVRKLVAKHAITTADDVCHVLYWGVAGQRVALSNARVDAAWARLATPAAEATPKPAE
jgi:hypothetical protein